MARMNVERGLERLAKQAEKMVVSAEKLVAAARKGDHSALAEKLDRLRLDLAGHLHGLAEHREKEAPAEEAAAPAMSPDLHVPLDAQGSELMVETNTCAQDEDKVDEASRESFPASDAPAY